MRQYHNFWTLLAVFIFGSHASLQAHEGHDHGVEESAATETLMVSRTETHNERFELLLKFIPTEPGDSLEMVLYVCDYKTNVPMHVEALSLVNVGMNGQAFIISENDKGIYRIKTIMPEEKAYDFSIAFQLDGQSYTMDLRAVDFAHHHLGAAAPHEHTTIWMYVGAFGLLLLGLLLGRFTAMRKYNRGTAVLAVLLSIPLMHVSDASAHEGHDTAPTKVTAMPGNHFELAKESQFLMQVYTQIAGESAYQDGRKLYGTIIPSSGGQSHVMLPQHGRITQLNVTPGQRVAQGAVLAVIERSVDPANEMLMSAERNRLKEEAKRLQLEVERLRNVGDIVSKKEMEMAESAYSIAKSNLDLYQTSGRYMSIQSPIAGIVSPFTYQVGDLVNGGTDLFTITNINKVYVETQAFEKDVQMIAQASRFLAQCADGNHSTESIRLLSLGSEFNSANQSQKVLFEVDNATGDFKIGEFVNVWTYSSDEKPVLAVPNSAITELEGRPVVFVKHSAEQLELRYVALGRNNGQTTVLENGLKLGERYVTEGAYQCKLVHLNQ
jgi:cobalt-zinc-cadmium efflux system membrane fusion protein